MPLLGSIAARRYQAVSPDARGDVPLDRYRVLVVDDLHASADTLAMMLDGLGQEIRTAYDGASALSIVREFHPDVVISDIAMPTMDGYHLAQRIRKLEGERPFLIALTGYGQKHDRARALNAGFNAHLVKPTSLDDLRGVIHSLASGGVDGRV